MDEQPPDIRPLILVVDDSRLMRVAARKILKEHFEVIEAEDGEAAWELIGKEAAFALVMSDLSMPHLDGLGLLDRIRADDDPRIRDLPVVIVTGAEDSSAAREQAMEKQSRLDGLTELLNERAFLEHGEQGLSYAVRHQSNLSLVRLEVRDFNKLFLRHGKAAAEQILKDMAAILKGHLRREDSAARLGMSQFGILLPGGTAAGVHSLMERIGAQITRLQYDFGSATFNAGIGSLEQLAQAGWTPLLEMAQQHLQQAKQAGENCISTPLDSAVVHGATPEAVPPPPSPEPETGEAVTAVETGPSPDVASALAMIERNAGDDLAPHLDTLVRQLLPLLDLWDQQHGGELSVCFQTLRRKLESR
jgi:two-component system, cell cycle response regulator